jgi:hypothetical protein
VAEDFIVVSISRLGEGRSVAGVRVDGRGWIRLVGPHQDGALYPHHTVIGERAQPRLLDRLTVEADWPEQAVGQPENRLIEGTRWRLGERPANLEVLEVVRRAVQTGPGLFGDGETRWRAARVKELPPAASLTLVEARHARLVVIEDRELWRKRVRVQFWLGGREWRLPLHDELYRLAMYEREEGSYPVAGLGLRGDRPVLLAVALGKPFQGWCYKSVVSIFQMPYGMERRVVSRAARMASVG